MLSIKIDDKEYELSCTFAVAHSIEKALGVDIITYSKGREGLPVTEAFNILNLATDNQISKHALEKYIVENFLEAQSICISFFGMYINPEFTKKLLEENTKKKEISQDTPA